MRGIKASIKETQIKNRITNSNVKVKHELIKLEELG